MKGVNQMNAKILVIPLAAALVGGCAWLNEQPKMVCRVSGFALGTDL